MSRQPRLAQHHCHQNADFGGSCTPAMEIDIPSRGMPASISSSSSSSSPSSLSRSTTTTTEQQQQHANALSHREQQLLKLKQQHEQLRLLEDQLRLARMDAPNPGSSSSSSRRKSTSKSSNERKSSSTGGGVGFCEDVFCYANPRNYEEIVASWYSKDELAVFKGERKDLIRELKRVDFDLDRIDRNVFHLRGLEPYLSIKYNKYMQKKRTSVLQTVLTEQINQRSREVKDMESIRVACCEASAWARERAADLGRRDAKAVGNDTCSLPASAAAAAKRDSRWGSHSDLSAAPSLCATASGSLSTHSSRGSISTHSSISISSEASLDSIRLRSPSMHRNPLHHRVPLARVDELPPLPYSNPL